MAVWPSSMGEDNGVLGDEVTSFFCTGDRQGYQSLLRAGEMILDYLDYVRLSLTHDEG